MERLKTFTDKRGSLTLLEVGQDIPFEVARVFWIHNVPEGQERGQHANTELSEYLVAVSISGRRMKRGVNIIICLLLPKAC